MRKLKPSTSTQWICSLLLVVVSVAPVFAETPAGKKDATDSKAPAETANPASANPAAQPVAAANPNPNVKNSANVTALLGVLVMKGVLAPAEANAIKDAAPEAEFQLLVEALAKGGSMFPFDSLSLGMLSQLMRYMASRLSSSPTDSSSPGQPPDASI